MRQTFVVLFFTAALTEVRGAATHEYHPGYVEINATVGRK